MKYSILLGITSLLLSCNSEEINSTDKKTTSTKINLIQKGQISDDQLNVQLIDAAGSTIPVTIQWTVENSDVATVSASGKIDIQGEGATKATAKVSHEGKEYKLTIPIVGKQTASFVVSPPAFMGSIGEKVEIEPFLLDPSNSAKYTITSADPSIVEIQGTKAILKKNGHVFLSVKGNQNGSSIGTLQIPFLVLGELPEVDFLSKIKITNCPKYIFKGDKYTFQAQAISTTGKVLDRSFTWKGSSSISTNTSGIGTASAFDTLATVTASSEAIEGSCKFAIYPDTVVTVTPPMLELKSGTSTQLTAKAWNLRNKKELTDITAFEWSTLSDLPGTSLFGKYKIDQTGKVTAPASSSTFGLIQAKIPNGPLEGAGASIILPSLGGFDPSNPTKEPTFEEETTVTEPTDPKVEEEDLPFDEDDLDGLF